MGERTKYYSLLHTSIVHPATMTSAADKMHEVFQTICTCSDAKELLALCARETRPRTVVRSLVIPPSGR